MWGIYNLTRSLESGRLHTTTLPVALPPQPCPPWSRPLASRRKVLIVDEVDYVRPPICDDMGVIGMLRAFSVQ